MAGGAGLVAIAAVCSNGVIGADGDQPWRNRDDFARFRRLTMGQVLIMGRKTYQAIGRPLPGRRTIVLTRSASWSAAGVEVAGDLDDALRLADGDQTVFNCGGGEVYRLGWDRTTRLEITEVHTALPGDITFPAIDPREWVEIERIPRDGFDWVSYDRR